MSTKPFFLHCTKLFLLMGLLLTNFFSRPVAAQPAEQIPPPLPFGQPATLGNWQLTFQDEFTSLNPSVWSTCPYGWETEPCSGYDEAAYRSQNVSVVNTPSSDGSALQLTAERLQTSLVVNGTSHRFVSGFIATHKSYSFKYGFMEARLKLPAGKGLWPAFWAISPSDACPKSDMFEGQSEIDALEMQSYDPRIAFLTLHRPIPNTSETSCVFQDAAWVLPDEGSTLYISGTLQSGGFADNNWHTFAVDWYSANTKTYFNWYVDGSLAKAVVLTGDDAKNFDARSLYLIANLSVGTFPGEDVNQPDESTPNSAEMLIDYIRVWQRTDNAPAPTALPVPTANPSAQPKPTNTPRPQPSPTPQLLPTDTASGLPAVSGNLVRNGKFNDQLQSWRMDNGAAQASMSVSNVQLLSVPPKRAALSVQRATGNEWEPSLRQTLPVRMETGRVYTVSFTAQSNVTRTINVVLQHDGFAPGASPSDNVWALAEPINNCNKPIITIRSKKFKCSFRFSVADPRANLLFWLGGAGSQGSVVQIDDVVFEDGYADLIRNGGFESENSKAGWLHENGAATGSFDVVSVPQNDRRYYAARVSTVTTSANNWVWEPLLYQTLAVPLASGQSYTLSFVARANSTRTIEATLQHNGYADGKWSDVQDIHGCRSHVLGTTAQRYVCIFTPNRNDDHPNLVFRLGGSQAAGSQVWIDDVWLSQDLLSEMNQFEGCGVNCKEVFLPLVRR